MRLSELVSATGRINAASTCHPGRLGHLVRRADGVALDASTSSRGSIGDNDAATAAAKAVADALVTKFLTETEAA